MPAQRYMHDYGVKLTQLAGVSVKNRRNGALNPDAQMRKDVTVEEVLSSRMVAEPFTLLQCCPTGDGAAAIILASDRIARQIRSDAISVRGSHLTSGRFMAGLPDQESPQITRRGANEAAEEAGRGPDALHRGEAARGVSVT